MSDIKFPDGIGVFAKNEKAPDFVGDTILIDRQKLAAWLLLQPEKIKLQIMTAKSGKKYLKVDDFTPSRDGANKMPPRQTIGVDITPTSQNTFSAPAQKEEDTDLPF